MWEERREWRESYRSFDVWMIILITDRDAALTRYYCFQLSVPVWSVSCFFIARQHTEARYWYSYSVRPFVCLSVCPSVLYVPVFCRNGFRYCYSFSPNGSQIILVLRVSNILAKIWRGTPPRGAKYRWGYKILLFSTNNSLYLANDTR